MTSLFSKMGLCMYFFKVPLVAKFMAFVFLVLTWCLSTLYWPYCMCLPSTTLRPPLSEQLGVSLLCTGHTVCVSHPLQSDLVYPNNLASLYSVLAILYVSHIHYTETSFIRTTWCLSTLYWPYCMCLTSTTLRPRLSEQLGVFLLCTDHTVFVSHPLHSDLVYPNNLVSLYSVLAILYVSHIHYSQTSFIRTTWCLSTLYWPYCMCLTSTTVRPRLSEQLGVSLLCTDHTLCVSHPLQSDLVYPNNLVSLYSVLAILYVSHIHYSQTSFIRTTWCLSTLYWPYCMCLTSTTLRPRLSEQLGVSLLCTGHTVCVLHPLQSDLVYPNNLVSLYPVLTILYVSPIHYTQTSFIRTTWCLSTLYWPYCMCLPSTTLRPPLSEQLGVSLLCTDHTVCVSHPLHSDLVYPNNLVSLYSVLTVLYVSPIHYTQTSFIWTTWCLSTLYWPYCMCLTSTTLRPRLSEQLGVFLLCTDHTVCVSHPLQSDLVYPNNLVSLYSVLTILYVSPIHYTQTSFIRTTWCLSTLYWPYCMCLPSTTLRPPLSEQLGVSLLCTDHTVCVLHPLQSDLFYPNNLVSLYSVLATLSVSYIHYSHTSFIRTTWCLSTLYWPYCMWLTSTTLRPRLFEQLGVSLLCTGHTVCVSHPLHSDLVYPNNLVSLYSVLAILYVSHIHYTQTSFIRTTWCLLYSVLTILYVSHIHYSQTSFIRTTWCLSTLYWPYCMCLTSTTVRPRLSEQLGVFLLCTDHTVCVSHPLHSDLVYPNNLVSLYSVLAILYVSHIHYSQTSFIRTTWCLSTLYWPYCMCLTSTTLRPRLSEQLGVFLLCTDHTVCVSHPLQSDLVYPNNLVSLFYWPFFFFIRLITLGI